jgi:hypothetical protein
MMGEVVGAPDGFVVEHEEVVIIFQVVDQLYGDVLLRVSEGAEPTVFTVDDVARIEGAEFGLVVVGLSHARN